jgi:hypothetical protein
MSELDVEWLARALDAHMVKFTEQPESYDSSTAVAQSIAAEYARLAESRPSDGLAAAVIEWADSEEVVRQNPSPSREEWHRVLVARERLRELRAALAESDSAASTEPVMSVAMSDPDEGPA